MVLASCSDYFNAMFSHNMVEARSDHLELKCLSASGFEILVDFAYSGHLLLNIDLLQDILCTANFLQIRPAIKLCTDFLREQMTFKNAEELLSIADIFSIQEFRDYYRQYILKNFLQFVNMDVFLKLDAETLIDYLSDDALDTTSESTLFHHVLRWYNHDPKNREKDAHDVFEQIRFTVDGWPVILYAEKVEPFLSNSKCKDLITFCNEVMHNPQKRHLYDNSTKVRHQKQTIVQFGGLISPVDYKDRDYLMYEYMLAGWSAGWSRNNYYHLDHKMWYPLGCIKITDFRSHCAMVEVNGVGLLIGGYLYNQIYDENSYAQVTRTVTNEVKTFLPSRFSLWDMPYLQHGRVDHTAVYSDGMVIC